MYHYVYVCESKHLQSQLTKDASLVWCIRPYQNLNVTYNSFPPFPQYMQCMKPILTQWHTLLRLSRSETCCYFMHYVKQKSIKGNGMKKDEYVVEDKMDDLEIYLGSDSYADRACSYVGRGIFRVNK